MQLIRFQIKVRQIVIHKTHKPHIVCQLHYIHIVFGKYRTEVDLLPCHADVPTLGNGQSFIMNGVSYIGWAKGLSGANGKSF